MDTSLTADKLNLMHSLLDRELDFLKDSSGTPFKHNLSPSLAVDSLNVSRLNVHSSTAAMRSNSKSKSRSLTPENGLHMLRESE